ncbi:HNH endonuclease family protein [Nonomuraea sp. NPDC049784]|uniref:HNH endonuclease family protein n=1 Tax=Nonomuraea sp. NPDC049784 TaxID=3154361 RepID=UPI0033C2BA7B
MRHPLRRSAILAAALVATLIAASPSQAAAQRLAAAAAPPLLWDAVADLPVSTENRQGYQRTSFKHWIDADRDSCNTRNEVLIDEAIEAPQVGERCTLTGGRWYSYYDNVTVGQASALDVDHLVPLAEAWDSGASNWTPQQREDYANDLSAPYHLVAVTARSNRSKADQDPADWLPPYEPARCRYVTEWTAVKVRWGLTVDTREKAALTEIAQGCPNEPLPLPDEAR